MVSGASIKDLKVQVTNKQILSIALPLTFAILVPQINMLTNSIFLGHLSIEALGNAGITGVFYLIFAVAGGSSNDNPRMEISNEHKPTRTQCACQSNYYEQRWVLIYFHA